MGAGKMQWRSLLARYVDIGVSGNIRFDKRDISRLAGLMERAVLANRDLSRVDSVLSQQFENGAFAFAGRSVESNISPCQCSDDIRAR